jgi:uncharacterized membrane protein YdjX (TVP38/TMEM64 family)
MNRRSQSGADPAGREGGPTLRRIALVGALIVVACAGLALLLRDVDAFDLISAHRSALLAWRDEHLLLGALLFVLAYFAIVTVSLPLNFAMTVLGGFLFGFLAGTLLSVFAVTAGAILVFTVAKARFGDRLRRRILQESSRRLFASMDGRFRRNPLLYLLLLRLTPTLPSIVPNAAPAFFGVKTITFLVATLLGVIPNTLVTAWIGAGLGEALAADETPPGLPAFDPFVVGVVLVCVALVAAALILHKRLQS